MKRLTLLCLSIFIFKFSYTQHISFGLKNGITYYKMRSTEELPATVTFNKAVGLDAGFLINASFKKKLGIQIEPSFVGKSFQYKFRNNSGNNSFYYINCPILLKLFPTKPVSILLGPELAYMAVHDANFKFRSNLDLGIDAGLSFLMGKRIYLAIKYNVGLLPFSKAYTYENTNGNDVLLSKFYLQGWIFDFGVYILN